MPSRSGRSNAAEGVGFYPGVIGATYLANPNYSVTVVPGNFTVLPLRLR